MSRSNLGHGVWPAPQALHYQYRVTQHSISRSICSKEQLFPAPAPSSTSTLDGLLRVDWRSRLLTRDHNYTSYSKPRCVIAYGYAPASRWARTQGGRFDIENYECHSQSSRGASSCSKQLIWPFVMAVVSMCDFMIKVDWQWLLQILVSSGICSEVPQDTYALIINSPCFNKINNYLTDMDTSWVVLYLLLWIVFAHCWEGSKTTYYIFGCQQTSIPNADNVPQGTCCRPWCFKTTIHPDIWHQDLHLPLLLEANLQVARTSYHWLRCLYQYQGIPCHHECVLELDNIVLCFEIHRNYTDQFSRDPATTWVLRVPAETVKVNSEERIMWYYAASSLDTQNIEAIVMSMMTR